ncbi:MAG: hybrid sensor histidine kinase/response regulator [Candidatus Dadabacteria bacterium]|nr:MAG: hybrid sensor histidine kinase/response regulator [Candidatus Dadabacteria bacterium]
MFAERLFGHRQQGIAGSQRAVPKPRRQPRATTASRHRFVPQPLQALRRLLRRHVAEFFDYPESSPEVELAFARFRRDLAIRMIQLIAIALSIVVVVLWPADLYVFANDPDGMRILFVFRSGVVLAAITVWFLLARVPRARQHPVAIFVAIVAVKLAADGWAVSRFAGPTSQLFYPIYVIPFVTVLLIVPLRARILATLTLVTSWFGAFYLTTPGHWLGPHSWTPILFLTGVSLSAIALGHVIYVMVRGNFIQRVELLRLADAPLPVANVSDRFVALSAALRQRDAAQAERERSELLDRLASGLNHALNNQLQVVLSGAQYLLDSASVSRDEEAVTALGDMVAAVEAARDLTRQLRALGSPPASRPEPVDVVAFAKKVAAILIRSWGGRPRIDVTANDEAIWVNVSRSELQDLFVHIMTASVSLAADDQQPIRIACTKDDTERCVTVTIHNPGERCEGGDVTSIFEPFWRRPGSDQHAGILLASARRLSRRMAGDLTARARLDGTLEYVLVLPLTDVSRVRGEEQTAPEVAAEERRPLHVLYCEDEEPVRHLITRAFQRAGHQVTAFGNGTEALTWLREHLDEVDVLLTDVVMPGLRGFELAHLVRQLRQNLPVVFLTAQAEPGRSEHEWGRDDASAVLFKPVPATEVVATVEGTVAAVNSGA